MKLESRLYMIFAIVVILLVANVGLYFRLNKLENQVVKLSQSLQPPEALPVGGRAPYFELNTPVGQRISLNDFEGEPVLLVFSSIGCPACQDFWPYLLDFSIENPSLEILMISRGTIEENSDLVEALDARFPIIQWDDKIAEDYKVPGTPYLYLISKRQTISLAGFGPDLDRVAEIVSAERGE